MVLIKSIRNIIRPVTLTVRLSANIIAGILKFGPCKFEISKTKK